MPGSFNGKTVSERRGYAQEAASALEHARRDLRLNRLLAITSPGNASSIAVLTKLASSSSALRISTMKIRTAQIFTACPCPKR